MIQRKQSIFLLIAFIVSVVCLCQPLGTVEPAGMGASFKLNNLFLDKGDSVDYSVCGLFCILPCTVQRLIPAHCRQQTELWELFVEQQRQRHLSVLRH